MVDSFPRGRSSFREGWCPIGRSPDVMRGFLRFAHDFLFETEPLYYFKPIREFNVPGLTEDEKFEDIDSYIVEEFGCTGEDIITVGTERYGPVIVMPDHALQAARVKLPRWREPKRRGFARRGHLTLVSS